MNNNWLKYLVALSAVLIAGSAAYFSVTGLGVLFSGAAVAVMVMASSLEFAKLVSATYLKQRWNEIKGFNKWYLSFAVGILMLITSAGIFGYLSNAFQQQNLALQQVDRQIATHTSKIEQNNSQITQLSTQITESNNNQGKILDNGKVNSRLLRSIDNRDKQISKLNDKISKLQEDNAKENEEINKIKTLNLDLEKEVGGFRFVAEAFGVELNTVVKFFIILIVIVFDPLAIALIIAFNQLIMLTKKGDEEEVDVKDVVEESAKIKLSEEDFKKLEEVLLNPPLPNEKLKEASKRYSDEVREKHTYINDFDVEHKRRGELLAEMMKNDQELGLYDEPFDNPMIKEPNEVVPALSDEEVNEMVLNEWERKEDDNISDWDVTLMDGLEDEEPFFTEEEIEKILQEEPTEEEIQQNFSTVEPNLENNFQEEDWSEELEEQYWREQVPEPFATDVELEDPIKTFSDEFLTQAIEEFNRESLEDEPIYQSNTKEIDQMLDIVNNVIDENNENLDTSLEDDEKKKSREI
jgi:cell division protein FtsB